MSNHHQLLLLCDHIKLSLLERQRATSLNLDPNPTAESNISRSLESLREGIESLSQRSSDSDAVENLRNQYHDLSRQFHGDSSSTADTTLTSPNNQTLKDDFTHAQARTSQDGASRTATKPSKPPQHRASNLKSRHHNEDPTIHSPQPQSTKAVRFRDDPSTSSVDNEAADDETRAALFPARYRDNPDPDDPSLTGIPTPDPTAEMSNTQIHTYHNQVLAEQDSQLDTLSDSIGRQRHLAMDIGDELDGQAALLEDVEGGVDRHQGRLDTAKKRLTWVGRKAGQNWGMTTIVVLIAILVLLIIVLK